MTDGSRFWAHLRDLLSEDGPRLVTGVPADEPELLDAASVGGGRIIVCRDQRLAAFAAAGWGLTEERAGVLALQAGPAFENARVGILEAASLGAPVVAIVTANPLDGIGRGGFQELDVSTLHPELFRWEHHVQRPEDLDWAIRTALAVAEGARPGPVLVSIRPEIVHSWSARPILGQPPARPRTAVVPDERDLEELVEQLDGADRVAMVLGGGARRRRARTVFAELARVLDASVLVTASGRGSYPEEDPRFAGLCGIYLTPRGRSELAHADLILVIGSRLEETARTGWPASGRILRIDSDPVVLETSPVQADGFVGDAEATARALVTRLCPRVSQPRELPHPDKRERPTDHATISAPAFWRELGDALAAEPDREGTILCQENGLADLWGYFADALVMPDGVECIVPGEQTAMGFGLGAALGASVAGRRVLAVCGDGALEQNLSWLITTGELRANIRVLVLRNRRLGWPAQSRDPGDDVTKLHSERDLVAFAASCGFAATAVGRLGRLRTELTAIMRRPGPRLVEVDLPDLSAIPGVSSNPGVSSHPGPAENCPSS